MNVLDIDVNFDFTTDTPNYWNNFWGNNNGLGSGGSDPDSSSKVLRQYHKLLWSKPLPNGEFLDLKTDTVANYLSWRNFRFGSDSITASFRYERYKNMIEKVKNVVPDYRKFMENYIRCSYTIGGMIIFPKRPGGINQSRGCNHKIRDRWDLTLECIRKYYNGEKSPIYDTLNKDEAFFDLFVDFKGYVDFFYLQDCVSDDYCSVNFWIGDGDFTKNPLPQTVSDYLTWIDCELQFVASRNKRIQEAIFRGDYQMNI